MNHSDGYGTFRSDMLAGQVVIVTGGATGIGYEITRGLIACGAAAVVLASRKLDNLERVAAEASGGRGTELMPIAVDIKDGAQVDAMVARTVERFGRLDVLINNAGANFLAPATEITPNGWRAVIDVVLNGSFLCARAAGRAMIAAGRGGRIINMSATNGEGGSPLMAHSGAGKAGLISLTETLASEWGQAGIAVNAVSPGAVDTPGAGERLWPDPETKARLAAHTPLGQRFASPEDCAAATLFLLSPAAAFITGATLVVDGGARLKQFRF